MIVLGIPLTATFLGVPLGLDVGTFLGLLATGAAAAGFTRRIRDRVQGERRAAEAARQAEAQRAFDAADTYRTHTEALAIHESLTTLGVFEALTPPSSEESAAGEFLIATYKRAQSRYLAFKDSAPLPDGVEALIHDALTRIARTYPTILGADQKAFEHKQRQRTADNSKYSWDGAGSYPKIWTINLIAQKWAADHRLTSRADFEGSFGRELRAAVPDRAAEYDANWLLTTTTDGKYKPKDTYLREKLLVLDGAEYGVHWRCGFKDAQVGTAIHKPVIEYFRRVHGYPAEQL